MGELKLSFRVCLFSLCVVALTAIGAHSNESSTSPNPNVAQDSELQVSLVLERLDALEKRFVEEMSRQFKSAQKNWNGQFKSLKKELDDMKNENSVNEDVWLLTPPLRGRKGEKGDSGLLGPRGKAGRILTTGQTGVTAADSCVLEEKWLNVHHHDNTGSSDVKAVVRATVGVGFQKIHSNSTHLDNPNGSQQAELFATIAKSSSTGFDWTLTPFSIWTGETSVTKTYTCEAQSSCVLKQLVGQCGNVRVPVDKFCQVSVPTGSPIPESCTDSRSIASCSMSMEFSPSPRSKKQTIYPHGNSTSLEVLCDFEVDGGGWTLIQKRSRGPKNEFNRTWNEYVKGFGSLDGNFWLGLENIRALTKKGDQELRIDLEDFEGNKKHAKYSNFSVSDASDFYRLSIGGYSGDAGNDMIYSGSWGLLNGMQFSTKDKDNDKNSGAHCAVNYPGGWWFNACFAANLNGVYRENGETVPSWQGIIWSSWKGSSYSLAKTEMKIRKRK